LSSNALALMKAATMPESPLPKTMVFRPVPMFEFSVTMFRSPALGTS
jgi:hypothetical protein